MQTKDSNGSVRMRADRQATSGNWKHLATRTQGRYGTRASPGVPISKPLGMVALLMQPRSSNRVLPSWRRDIHNIFLRLPRFILELVPIATPMQQP